MDKDELKAWGRLAGLTLATVLGLAFLTQLLVAIGAII